MATKYLTLRAEFVETGQRDCEQCIFEFTDSDNLISECGIERHPKFNEKNCETGYWKEIDLTK